MIHERRPLGRTDIRVSPIALGCWPISGMTSLNVSEDASRATLERSLDEGVNFFDTAYCYGRNGESERLIQQTLGHRRSELVIATKGGLAWDDQGRQLRDASPATLRRQCEESLRRLGTEYVELYYLHAPDPNTPLTESAAALAELRKAGKTRAIGASNMSAAQLAEFHAVCPLDAIQPPYNMLQREIESEIVPWCMKHGISIMVYWPLLKGLLAGKLPREHVFAPGDGRAKYPMFQGDEWLRNQDLLDRLRPIAAAEGKTLAQLVINWTIHQPGITAALCGAKRPDQAADNAGAAGWTMSAEAAKAIAQALDERGVAVTQPAVA